MFRGERPSTLTPDTVKARLMTPADKWTGPTGRADLCTYGAGYVDIPAALASTAKATQSALSPSLVKNANGTVSVNMSRVIWGTSGEWGSGVTGMRVIRGTSSMLSGSNPTLTASSVIWGTSTASVDLSNVVLSGE